MTAGAREGPALAEAEDARCSRCGLCVRVCPKGVLCQAAGEPPRAEAAQAEACIRCGQCVAVCPGEALRHRDLTGQAFPPAPLPPGPEGVLALLRSRRSVRQFRPAEVPRELLERLLEAARYAPTGHNARELGCVALLGESRIEPLRREILRFYRRVLSLVRNRLTRPLVALAVGPSPVRELLDALPGLQRAEERIARGEDPLFHGAPAVLLLHAPRGRETSETDCALAADHLTLYAPSLGFGTCHIGYAAAALKRMPKAARTFGIPAGHCTFAVLTAGYPDVRYARLPPRPPIPLRYS